MNDMRRVHAEQLVSSLELSLPPVAIAFCDVVPDDVPMFEGVVPAGCAFYATATARDATVVVPPNKTARVSRRRPRSSARDRTTRKMATIGRRRWKQASGDPRQVTCFRDTSIKKSRLRARSPGGRRLLKPIGCVPPAKFEARYYEQAAVA